MEGIQTVKVYSCATIFLYYVRIVFSLFLVFLVSACEWNENGISGCKSHNCQTDAGTLQPVPDNTTVRAIETNQQGAAMSVWNVGNDVYAQQFLRDVGWQTSQLLSEDESYDINKLDVSMLGQRATVAWEQSNGSGATRNVLTLGYSSSGWEQVPVQINEATPGANPVLAINRFQSLGGIYSVSAFFTELRSGQNPLTGTLFDVLVPALSSRTLDSDWSAREILVNTPPQPWIPLDLDIARSGLTFKIWHRAGSDNGVEIHSVFISHTSNGVEQLHEFSSVDPISDTRIASDESSNAVAVWIQNGMVFHSYYNAVQNTWLPPFELSLSSDVEALDIAVNRGGEFVIAWTTASGEMLVQKVVGNGQLLTAVNLQTGSSTAVSNPNVGIDANGNARAIWIEGPSGYTATYSTETLSWSEPEQFSDFISKLLVFDMDEHGMAIAVWNGGDQIWMDASLTVSVQGDGGGSVSSDDGEINCGGVCSADYQQAATVVLAANADSDSVFAGWSGDQQCGDNASDNNTTIITYGAINCTAIFNLVGEEVGTLNVSQSGTGSGLIISSQGGINCGSDCTEQYPEGTTMVLDAIADTGSVFIAWSGDGSCANSDTLINSISVTINGTTNCVAVFDTQTTGGSALLTVTKNGSGTGIVTGSISGIECGSDCTESFSPGTHILLAATADPGSTFVGWSGDGDCGDPSFADGNLVSVTVNTAMTCTATFN